MSHLNEQIVNLMEARDREHSFLFVILFVPVKEKTLLFSLSTHALTKYMDLSHTKYSATPIGCPIIQYNSATVYLELASDPTG